MEYRLGPMRSDQTRFSDLSDLIRITGSFGNEGLCSLKAERYWPNQWNKLRQSISLWWCSFSTLEDFFLFSLYSQTISEFPLTQWPTKLEIILKKITQFQPIYWFCSWKTQPFWCRCIMQNRFERRKGVSRTSWGTCNVWFVIKRVFNVLIVFINVLINYSYF